MGQGGKITLVNSTNTNWKKVHEHSYQMNSWKFPDEIKAKTSVSVYIEWDQYIFDNQSDDAGEVDYKLEGTQHSFQIQARGKEKFDIKAFFKNIETHSNKTGSTISLGWEHDGYITFILSGAENNYFSTNLDGATWMQNNLKMLGSKALNEICITGSHDAGMSTKTSGTGFASECNTLTQSHKILDQLLLGARYFDIRPAISAGKYLTGHYSRIDEISSWQGANGQSIDSVIDDINSFTASHKELVVLNLSHSLNTDVGNSSYRPLNQKEWDALFLKFSKLQNLYIASKEMDLTSISLEEYISLGSAVIIIVEDGEVSLGDYEGKGFFKYSCFNVFNKYANKNDVSKMADDQFKKMKEHPSEYFLLSWTLTQSPTQAATCSIGSDSIKELANEANQRLADLVFPEVSHSNFPNIIYTDNILTSNAASMALAFNMKKFL